MQGLMRSLVAACGRHASLLQPPAASLLARRSSSALASSSSSSSCCPVWQQVQAQVQVQQHAALPLALRLAQQPPRALLAAAAMQQPPACTSAGGQARSMATRVEQQAAANPGLKFWRPTSPGQRGRVTVRRLGIWQGPPLRCLTQGAPRISGRNAYGRITVRHRGGGAKRKLRLVDFQRLRLGEEAVVQRLEYDPNRSAYLALLKYPPPPGGHQPQFSYVLAPQDVAPGDTVASGPGAAIKPGNTLALKDIPVGMPIHNIELQPGRGGQLCRAAGCLAAIVNKQEEHAIVRLPSGEQRLINLKCRATIGAVSNPQNKNRVLGKAGASRNLGRRPTVRGVAMNSVDHPMGGGTAGGRPSCSPWGLHSKGKKTRPKHKASSRWILSRRSKRAA